LIAIGTFGNQPVAVKLAALSDHPTQPMGVSDERQGSTHSGRLNLRSPLAIADVA
jgi:hypothetical protein